MRGRMSAVASEVAPEIRSPWLFGPARDLLFGCGLLYLLVFAAISAIGPSFRLTQPLIVFPLLILALSAPHYGATILRVYEQARDRRAYAFFSIWATLLVIAWFVCGLFDHRVGSWMLTLYLIWSPWHYTGQNYGIGVMFLRRAGTPLDPVTKRSLHASFVLSFLVTAIVLNTDAGPHGYGVIDAPSEGAAIRFLPLGIPGAVTAIVVPVLAVGWLVATLLAAHRLVQRAPLRSLAPLAMIAATHAMWFGVPFLAFHFRLVPFESLDFDLRTYYFTWIALAHALQYLWVTTYYARSAPSWPGTRRYYLKALIAGKALFVLPVVVFAPLGVLSYDGGLALLVSAAVNLHHFILDGAIWKLRHSRVAKILIRSGRDANESDESASSRRLGLPWVVATACMAAGLFILWTDMLHVPRLIRAGDYPRAARALDQLGWLGFDHEAKRIQLAAKFLERNQMEAAALQARRSIDLMPSSEAFRLLGDAQLRGRFHAAALESYARALDLQPDSIALLLRLAQANAAKGDADRARDLLKRASALAPADDSNARATIEGLEARLAHRAAR